MLACVACSRKLGGGGGGRRCTSRRRRRTRSTGARAARRRQHEAGHRGAHRPDQGHGAEGVGRVTALQALRGLLGGGLGAAPPVPPPRQQRRLPGLRDRLRPLPLRVPTRRGRRLERGRHAVRERAHRLPRRRRGGCGGGVGRRDVFRRRRRWQGGQRQGLGGAGGAWRPHHARLTAARWERPQTHPIQCFTWIWEERLMEFINAVVLRCTRDLEDAIRTAKVDYEWRIHQLEHKIEAVSRDLEEARENDSRTGGDGDALFCTRQEKGHKYLSAPYRHCSFSDGLVYRLGHQWLEGI